MKKMFTLLAVSAIVSSGFAQYNYNNGNRGYNAPRPVVPVVPSSSFIVNSYSDESYSIVVDGYQHQINKGRRKGNYTNIGRLNPGNHSVSVYVWKTNLFGKIKEKFVYSTNVYLKPNIETALVIDKRERFSISEQPIYINNIGKEDYRRRR